MRRLTALAYGATCHGLFIAASGAMLGQLFSGMRHGLGPRSWAAIPWDLGLVAQFAVGHSGLLSTRGRHLLRRLAPASVGGLLDTTLYATAAAVQVGLLFRLWVPLPTATWAAPDAGWWAAAAAFTVAALGLGVALWEAGLGVQLGATGWTALWRGDAPRVPRTFAQSGLHGVIRHPIYVGFALLVWLGPEWSLDKVLLAAPLTAYCLVAPRRKEQRYRALHGAAYATCCATTPAFLPRLRPRSPAPVGAATRTRPTPPARPGTR